MTVWEANLAALGHHHPELASRLAQAGPPAERGEWSQSRSGDATVRRSGVWWSSSFDPRAEAARAVPSWELSCELIVLTGLGVGYLAESVALRYPDLPIIIAEPDPQWFSEVLARRDLSSLLTKPEVILLVSPDAGDIYRFLRSYRCSRIEVLGWRPLSSAWESEVRDRAAEAQALSGVNEATYRRFSELWQRNLFRNENSNSSVRPLAALAGWARGLPAVVAAAGPTLADSLPWLLQNRGRFILVAVDTAWSALAAHGIDPDVLLVLDGQYWNARHVDRIPSPRTVVVTEWTGPPRAFRLNPSLTYVAATSIPFLRPRERAVWGDLGPLPSGGSVATAAWSLCVHLGCSEVAFAGLDLGYPRGQTHVPGSQFEEAIHRHARRLGPAETLGLGLRGLEGITERPSVDGGVVLSDRKMDLFRTWLEAAVAAQPEIRAVNLSPRGSLIGGLEAATPDYGSQWPPRPVPPAPGVPVHRCAGPVQVAPFGALERLARAEAPSAQWEADWSEVARFWGPAWELWAGRARRSWDRWPSLRTWAGLVEVATSALDWKRFWEPQSR